MSAGRNEPCPCGSGKKYKKCCLAKDEAARPTSEPAPKFRGEPARAPLVGAAPAPSPPPRELTEAERVAQARWDNFRTADLDGKIAQFERAVAEPAFDADDAFEMFNDLSGRTDSRDHRGRLIELIDRLGERHPETYASNEFFFLASRLRLGLGGSDTANDAPLEDVVTLATRAGTLAGTNSDLFTNLHERLAWHGRLDALLPAMRAGWPGVRESKEIFGWAIDEFANKGVDAVILDWIERRPEAREVDAELRGAIAFFLPETPAEKVDAYVGRLAGWAPREWSSADFQFLARPRRKQSRRDEYDDDYEQEDSPRKVSPAEQAERDDEKRLSELTTAFVPYARLHERIPPTRANLFRARILDFLVERRAGKLVKRESMFQAMMRPGGTPAPKPKPPVLEHVLTPDRSSLDYFMGAHFGIMAVREYSAAVTLELAPAWLRFLVSLGLLTAERQAATLHELRKLPGELLPIVRQEGDVALVEALERWPAGPRADAEPAPAPPAGR